MKLEVELDVDAAVAQAIVAVIEQGGAPLEALGTYVQGVVQNGLDDFDVKEAVTDSFTNDIDWESHVDSRVDDVIEGAVQEKVDDQVRDYLSGVDWSDYVETPEVDTTSLADQLNRELNSLPDDHSGRCSLGLAFTQAVQKVLRDSSSIDAIWDRVRERFPTQSLASNGSTTEEPYTLTLEGDFQVTEFPTGWVITLPRRTATEPQVRRIADIVKEILPQSFASDYRWREAYAAVCAMTPVADQQVPEPVRG